MGVISNALQSAMNNTKITGTVKTIGGIVLAGMAVTKAYNAVQNDATRKNLINDLHMNDPVLSKVDGEQLLEWYATIYHFAPKFSLDKSAVREVLQNFARFGRVDVNTLKMLAETERATAQADSGTSWGNLFGNLASAATLDIGFGGK